MITVRVPGMLRQHLGIDGATQVEASTVGEALRKLAERYPLLERHLFDGRALRRHIFAVANGSRILDMDSDVSLHPGDEVVILQAVSGG
jgi:molybdopterin converting factor small subunit